MNKNRGFFVIYEYYLVSDLYLRSVKNKIISVFQKKRLKIDLSVKFNIFKIKKYVS